MDAAYGHSAYQNVGRDLGHPNHSINSQGTLHNYYGSLSMPKDTLYHAASIQEASISDVQPLTLPSTPLAFYEEPQRINACAEGLQKFYRSTMQIIPNDPAVFARMKIPLSVTITPFADIELEHHLNRVPSFQKDIVPIVSGEILRCRKCRAYVNPYVSWIDGGARYKCNLCMYMNDVPSDYDFDTERQKSLSRDTRLELQLPVVEYMAPAEYMLRAPQANIFVFILDTSHAAVSSGALAVLSRSLLAGLDLIPNTDGRTKVAFCLVDDAVTMARFNMANSTAQLLVVPRDISDPSVVLPAPDDLLVNMIECRPQIEVFLNKLPTYFSQKVGVTAQPALGTALQMGHRLIGNTGGKLVCFLSALPGGAGDPGLLSPRDREVSPEKVIIYFN
jgi:protein transport protein SEC24